MNPEYLLEALRRISEMECGKHYEVKTETDHYTMLSRVVSSGEVECETCHHMRLIAKNALIAYTNSQIDKPNYRKTASKREIYIRFCGKNEWVRYPSKAVFRRMYPDIHFRCPTFEDEYKTIANEAETLFREFERTRNPIDAYRRWTSKWNPSGQYLATILNTARS